MIHLLPNEQILMVLHRHWIAFFLKFIIGAILLIIALLVIPYFPFLESALGISQVVLWFFALIYLMIVVLVIFVFWIDYYLDIWIITSERIIDIDQKGLFNREISEFMLERVQDVIIEVPNIMATFLKYGNLIIRTASEATFRIEQAPNVYEAKNLILDYAKKQNVRPL